jgi:hypothetical protein
MLSVTAQSEKPGREIETNFDSDSAPPQISKAKAWEESWPYVFGILAAGVCLLCHGFPIPSGIKDVFAAVVNTSGIFAAFFLTSASILVTLKDSWFKRRAMESGVYLALIGYMLTAMGWSIATAVTTTAALLFDGAWHLWWYQYALALWVFLVATTLGAAIRVLRIFTVLMKYIARE